jgi:biotin-(acetyl-CoA carboxylase) ligase
LQINVNEDMRSHPDPALRESATSALQALRDWQAVQPPGATSAAAVNTAPLSRESILASFASSLESLSSRPLSAVLSVYQRFDMLLGKRIVVMPRKREHADSFYEAEAIGYSTDGYLLVRTDDGQSKELVAEEVTIRPTEA